jgi:hypothetical protein
MAVVVAMIVTVVVIVMPSTATVRVVVAAFRIAGPDRRTGLGMIVVMPRRMIVTMPRPMIVAGLNTTAVRVARFPVVSVVIVFRGEVWISPNAGLSHRRAPLFPLTGPACSSALQRADHSPFRTRLAA